MIKKLSAAMESAFNRLSADDSYHHSLEGEIRMVNILLVGAGGFIGSVSRYLLGGYVQQWSRPGSFPYGTLAVNVIGCLIIGFLSQLADTRAVLSHESKAFLFAGFLGGFTTFSAFGNETINLWRAGESALAFANVGAQIVLGLGAVWLGRFLAYSIWR